MAFTIKKNPNWLPNHAKTEFGHVFTDKQLENLAHIVNRICDSQNVIITNQLMKNLNIAYYKSLNFHPQSGLKFNASSHFLSFFKKKFRFSTRRLHQKRRPSAPRVSVSNFLKRSKKIFKKADHSHIVNSDESFWRCEEYHLRTWAPTNSQSIILHTYNSEKSGFTALATIGLDGQKYPLILIAKGKTIAVESNWFGSDRSLNAQFQTTLEKLPNPFKGFSSSRKSTIETIVPRSFTDLSLKGWTNVPTWSNYLKALRFKFI